MIKLTDILNNLLKEQKDIREAISPSEAYNDEDSIQTVIDGKRNLGFIALKNTTIPNEDFWKLIKQYDLETIEVPSNPFGALIYFRKGAEKEAKELRDIAEKYEGFLAYDASDEDSSRIGELLGYRKEDVDAYIEKNKNIPKRIKK